MIPILFEKDARAFKTLGLGFLPAWIDDTIEVVEERNGEFYLQGELPVGGLHVDQLAIDRIILAAPAPGEDPQPFRIRKLSKPAGSETVQVLAQHVSYQLTEHVVKPFSVRFADASDTLDSLLGQGRMVPQIDSTPFSFESDIVLASPVLVDVDTPKSVRDFLGGAEGSMVDLYGGELEWDGWTVRLLAERGRDTGKLIRYGVNLGTLSYDTDITGLVTCYFGWWRDSGGFYPVYASVDTPNINDYAYPHVQIVDLSGKVDYDEDNQNCPTNAELLAALQAYVAERDENHLRTSITITAVPEELQDVKLCDTVTVVHPVYDLQQTAKLVKTVYDPIEERYKEITIGEIQKTITDTIAGLLRR